MGVNELYAIPSCQYSGYLDVKHPAGNRGKVAFRVWKRRYVVLNSMTNTLGAPEAKLEIYLSLEDWMQGRGQVPLLPQKPAWIRRCYSRTRAFAFKIQSSTGVVLLYLAGSDETDSQTWMRELRSIYWPRDMTVQPDDQTDSIEISIIDNNFTEQLGLCGSFWLRVGQEQMSLHESASAGEARYSWRLRELRRYFVARTQNEKDRNKVFCFTACDANDERSYVFFLQDAETLLRRIEKAQSELISTDMPKTSTENATITDTDDDEVESRRSRSNTDSTTISDKSENAYSSCNNWNNPSARNTVCNTEATGKRRKESYDYLSRFSKKNPDWRMSDDSHISEDDGEGPLVKERQTMSEWSLTRPRDRLTSAESSPDIGEMGGKFRNQEKEGEGPRRGSAPNTRVRETSGYSNISPSSEKPILESGEYLDMTGVKQGGERERPKQESGYLEMSGSFKASPPKMTEIVTETITTTCGLNLDQLQLTIHEKGGRSPIFSRSQDEKSEDEYVPFDEEAASAMANIERSESESSEANISFSSESGEYEFQESPLFRAKKLRNSARRKTTRTKIIDELYAPLNDQFDNLTGNIDSLLRETRPIPASPTATEAVEDIESSNEYGAIFTRSPIRLRRESKEPQSSLDSGIIVTSSGSSCSTSTQSSRSNSSYTDENMRNSDWTHDENMYKIIPHAENHYELEDCGAQTRPRSDSDDSDTYSMIRSRGNTLTGSDGVYECPSDLIHIQENENILDDDDDYVIFDGDEENEETQAPPLPQTPIPETPPEAEAGMSHFERLMSVSSIRSSKRDSDQSIASGWSVVTTDDVEEIQGAVVQNRTRRSGAFCGPSSISETYPPKAKPKAITKQLSLQPCDELVESSERSSGESTGSEGPERVKRSKENKKKKSTWTRLFQSKIFSKKDDSERERKRSQSHAAPPDEQTEAVAERSRRRSKSDTPPTLHRMGSKTFVKESVINPPVSPTNMPVSLRGGSKSSVTFQTPPPIPPRETIPKEIHHRSQSLPDPPDHDYHVNTSQKRTTSYPPPPVPPRPGRLSNELKSPPPVPERVFRSPSLELRTGQVLPNSGQVLPNTGQVLPNTGQVVPNGDKIPKRFTRSPSQDSGKQKMIRSASEDQGQSQFFPISPNDSEKSHNSDVFHTLPQTRPPPSLPFEESTHVITISKDGSELLDLELRKRGDSDASVASYASVDTVVDALGLSKE